MGGAAAQITKQAVRGPSAGCTPLRPAPPEPPTSVQHVSLLLFLPRSRLGSVIIFALVSSLVNCTGLHHGEALVNRRRRSCRSPIKVLRGKDAVDAASHPRHVIGCCNGCRGRRLEDLQGRKTEGGGLMTGASSRIATDECKSDWWLRVQPRCQLFIPICLSAAAYGSIERFEVTAPFLRGALS